MKCIRCGKKTQRTFCSSLCSNQHRGERTFRSSERNMEIIETFIEQKKSHQSHIVSRLAEEHRLTKARIYYILDTARKYNLLVDKK